ncbi:potassium transporter TrkA [Gordonia oryzae]|uniref:Potassium transporter TrkA n=1 Tax=Gordonia oryzae TaxID=2487349 RepID=A0A3N4GPS7_9ACTN|nr:NAD-binding protein [Gordonia oryzae]RPA63477.1 potassium transporter TrkA [Gordonia oryzae]
MPDHIIVHGDDALTLRITEELASAGARIITLSAPGDLADAGVGQAAAVVCAGSDDAVNLEIALLARTLDPHVRVVANLSNAVLRDAVASGNGPGAVLDVAELAAPSVVEACLGRTTHSIPVAGNEFVVSGAHATRAGTLRELYGDLAPVAVLRAGSGSGAESVVPCPGRDLPVEPGDWVSMIGTVDDLAAQGVEITPDRRPARSRRPLPLRALGAFRAFRDDVNPNLFRALGVSFALLAFATILLRFTYHRPGMSLVDALYFSTETIATVGYGDFSFVGQPTWLRLFAIGLMFAGVTTTAVLMAFVADLLLSRRIGASAARRRVRDMAGHILVVGLGSFGIRVATDLRALGHEVVVVERNDDNRFLEVATELNIPVIIGDATLRRTLADAGIDRAHAVAVLTHDDMVNIETGIILREVLGRRWSRSAGQTGVPVVLRVYDHSLGAAVAHRFGFENVRSTVELAAPWFIGAALGLQVISTFSVGRYSFMVGGLFVRRGSVLDGMLLADLPTRTRIIAIVGRSGTILHPRRDDRLAAEDTAYLVGPYHELLDTLQRSR